MNEIKTLELLNFTQDNININKNYYNKISLKQYINFLYIEDNPENIKNKYFESYTYDELCKKILYPSDIYYKKKTPIIQIDLLKLANIYSFNSTLNQLLKHIDINNYKSNLIISNYSYFVNRFTLENNHNKDKIEAIIYNSRIHNLKEIPDKKLDDRIKSLNINYTYLNNLAKLSDFLENTNYDDTKKFDCILIKHTDKFCNNYLKFFTIIKIPVILISLSIGLVRLQTNGDLYLFMRHGLINKSLEKIIDLLTTSFEKIIIIPEIIGTGYMLKCIKYKNNISKYMINKLIKIALLSKKYSHTQCDFFNYLCYVQTKYPDNNFYHKLDNEILKKKKTFLTTMKIINDIDLPFTNSLETQNIIYQIKKMYDNYEDELYKNIFKYSTFDNNKLLVDNDFINKTNYNKLLILINYFDSNNLPYNKSYLIYINKFNKNLLNQLFTYDYSTNQKIIKYNQKSSSFNKINILKESYYYNEFNTQYDLWSLSYKVKLNLFEKLKTDDTPKIIKQVSEGFARGVSAYIMQKFNLEHKISNAFCKLWEIYNSIKGILPMKANPKVFLMAEAPGQWIYCSNIYYYNNYIKKIKPYVKKSYKSYSFSSILKKTMKKNKSKKNYQDNKNGLDWRANSLNPNNTTNIQKYGKDIFNDQYGFMKKYPKQWAFGVDNTGDFTITENQRWYRQYVKEFGKLDLITGDAGIFSDNPSIFQKLELAQVCMVAGLLSKGGNCVIKHFLPYVRKVPSTYYATGLFINYMYLYYLMFDELHLIKPLTSNPDSGEFYVVGKGFKGIKDEDYERLLKLLDDFQPNMCFFEKDDIDDTFVRQIVEFAEKIIKMNVDHNEITNLLMTCMIENDEIIEKNTNCSKFLNKTYVEKIFSSKYHEWVISNNFQ
jgi:hypothetical protein